MYLLGKRFLLHYTSSQFADDHHAFHEDAKPGDLAGQFGTKALHRLASSTARFICVTQSGTTRK